MDLVELERLLEAVGWSRRPTRRVRKALEHSLITVGLWRHDPRLPRLVGFARCTGDGVLDATIWMWSCIPSTKAQVWENS